MPAARRRRPSPPAPIQEDEAGGFIRRPSIGAVAALLGVLGTIITGIIGYHDTQSQAKGASDAVTKLRADWEDGKKDTAAELEKYKLATASDLEKYKIATAADIEKFKTAQAGDLEKFKAEANAQIERGKSAMLLEVGKVAGRVDKLDERLTGVDNAGTAYGRSAYSAQNVDRANMKKQLDDTKTTVDALVPAVARIEAKLDAWGTPGVNPSARVRTSAR